MTVLIPAAGRGQRVGSESPKQYLPLAGKPMLVHTVERLQSCALIDRVVVALADDDTHFPALGLTGVDTVTGGPSRAISVLALLESQGDSSPEAWVLVHDAARPCVRTGDIHALITSVESAGADGGLLATRVRDTVKRARPDQSVETTVPRDSLWLAATPQLFRLGPLREALRAALAAGVDVTDEASAMEWAGRAVLLVEGQDDNIKVTRPGDLLIAASILEAQRREFGEDET